MNYQHFLEQKKHLIGNFGFEPNYIPDIAFDFQKHIIEKSVRKGRIGVFADTGLGKTLIQLAIANNVIKHTNKKVLILIFSKYFKTSLIIFLIKNMVNETKKRNRR